MFSLVVLQIYDAPVNEHRTLYISFGDMNADAIEKLIAQFAATDWIKAIRLI